MFQHICREKDGDVLRTVRFMDKSVGHILETIDRLKTVPNFLPPDNEVQPFLSPGSVFFEVDDVGLLAFIPTAHRLAHVHISFWDKRLRGREELCRTVAEWVVGLTGMILATGIPESAPAVLAFAKRVGFGETNREHGIVVLTFPNYTE